MRFSRVVDIIYNQSIEPVTGKINKRNVNAN